MKKTFLYPVLLLAGVAACAYAYWARESGNRIYTSIAGLTLGESATDIRFKHADLKIDIPLPMKPDEGDADETKYSNKTQTIQLTFKQNKVSAILYMCVENSYLAPVNEISCGDSGDKISQQFGKHVRILCNKEGAEYSPYRRIYATPEYGMRYLMWQNKVIGYSVKEVLSLADYDSKPINNYWGTCK